MTTSAIVTALPRRRTSRPPAPKTRRAKRRKVLTVRNRRSLRQVLAALAAGFLPVGSYVLVHAECEARPALWAIVAAALAFSAPTLADWAYLWTSSRVKAWGFTALLEGVMIASDTPILSLGGLVILCAINCASAWDRAGALQPAGPDQ